MDDAAADLELQRAVEWVETSPRARRRRRRLRYFLTTTQRYHIGVIGVGAPVHEVHASLAARFQRRNRQEGLLLRYSIREFDFRQDRCRRGKGSPLVLALRSFAPNLLVVVQSASSLASLPAPAISDLTLRCCQAANPRDDIDPFHVAVVVRTRFVNFDDYQRRVAGKPWCAVGQFTSDETGLDEIEALAVRLAVTRVSTSP